jgi:hypothetical protein
MLSLCFLRQYSPDQESSGNRDSLSKESRDFDHRAGDLVDKYRRGGCLNGHLPSRSPSEEGSPLFCIGVHTGNRSTFLWGY